MEESTLNDLQVLTAEVFNYSYDYYRRQLEMGDIRFTKLMPNFVAKLRDCVENAASKKRAAIELDIPERDIAGWFERYARAKPIVSAENASESFREAVFAILCDLLPEQSVTDELLNDLVVQICYRAADMGHILKGRGQSLSDYSAWLRRVPGQDYADEGLPKLEKMF